MKILVLIFLKKKMGMLKIVLQEIRITNHGNIHHLPPMGWGNGYVLLPINHVYYGVDLYIGIPVNVHGGLTYADEVTENHLKYFKNLTEKDIGYWMIGFDTSHYMDDMDKWPREAVLAEAEYLRRQLT